jgi:hypothetical protein
MNRVISAMRNAALSAIVGGITDTVAALSMLPTTTATAKQQSAAQPPLSPIAASNHSDDTSTSQSSTIDSGDGTEGKNYRMDIQDFIE